MCYFATLGINYYTAVNGCKHYDFGGTDKGTNLQHQ